MKNLFILCLTLLTGCIAYYPEVTDIENSAVLKFKHNTDALLGSTSGFYKIDDDLVCNSRGGFTGQLQLAFLSKGNPLARSKNENGIRVLAEDNFRVLIRNTPAGSLSGCDAIISFNVEKQKIYTISFSGGNGWCSATVEEIEDSNNSVNVELLESESC